MKAADGVQIAERYRDRHTLLKCWTEAGKHPKTEYNTFEFAQEIVRLIEDVSRAEEREQVLRETAVRLLAAADAIRGPIKYAIDLAGSAGYSMVAVEFIGAYDALRALTAAPEQGKEAKS